MTNNNQHGEGPAVERNEYERWLVGDGHQHQTDEYEDCCALPIWRLTKTSLTAIAWWCERRQRERHGFGYIFRPSQVH